MAKITYDDKEIYVDGTTNNQYFRYQDANEIKNVVNTNDTRLEHLYELLSQETTQTGTEITIDNTFADNMQLDLKGNSSQYTTTGKNLFNITDNSNTSAGVTITNTNNKITFVGKPTRNYVNSSILSYNLPAGTYTISSTNNNYDFFLWFKDDNNTTIATANLGGSTSTITLSQASIKIQYGAEHLDTNTTYNIETYFQIEKGSSATSWEPYTGGIPSPNPSYPQEIKVVTGNNTINITGKNWLGLTNGTYSNAGVTAVVENGKITLNGTASGTSFIRFPLLEPITLQANTNFTMSANNSNTAGSSNPYGAIRLNTGSADDSTTDTLFNVANNTLTFSKLSDTTYTNFCIRTGGGITYNNFVIYPQLEIGNSSSNYEQYQSQILPVNLGSLELCKIGDYQDYIYKDNGKWYKHSEIGRVVLDGSESWRIDDTYQGITQFRIDIDNVKWANDNVVRILSNYFKGVKYPYSWTTDNTVTSIFSNSIRLMTSLYTSVADFKNWLSTHNTSIYYVLATATDTEITDTTLIEQLNNILNAQSYDYQTNITQTNAVLPFIITATARVERS